MGDKKLFKCALISAACSLAFIVAGSASAANWLILQGTEDPGASPRANVWGFIQANYQKDYSKPNASDQYVAPKVLGPDLDTQHGFNINRARIGVRGTGFPIDSNINYFLLAEFGNNGTTHSASEYTLGKLTDASITLNQIPGARIRTGLFKYPGAEEGLQAIHVFDYINFTEITNGVLLERFPNHTYTANLPAQTQTQLQTGGTLNGFNSPVGAFRDVGIQVFDAFDVGHDWEASYAVMMGEGSGIEFDNTDGKYDTYLYASLEKKLGGKGPKAEGLKFFGWSQKGQRLLDNTAAPACVGSTVTDSGGNTLTLPCTTAQEAANQAANNNPKLYKRERFGFGVKYLAKPFRVTAEYIRADGMIWVGPDKPTFTFAGSNGAEADANGWYVEGGWYIPDTKWELDARVDTMTRLKGAVDEHRFNKRTVGIQYHFNPKSRVTLNYEMRDFSCTTSTTACTNANKNLDGVGNKLGIQMTAIY